MAVSNDMVLWYMLIMKDAPDYSYYVTLIHCEDTHTTSKQLAGGVTAVKKCTSLLLLKTVTHWLITYYFLHS